MTDKDTPAFPTLADNGHTMNQDGMTLRDYFAAKAMQPFLTGAVLPTKKDRDEWLPNLAEVAYEAADAMIEARKGGAS